MIPYNKSCAPAAVLSYRIASHRPPQQQSHFLSVTHNPTARQVGRTLSITHPARPYAQLFRTESATPLSEFRRLYNHPTVMDQCWIKIRISDQIEYQIYKAKQNVFPAETNNLDSFAFNIDGF